MTLLSSAPVRCWSQSVHLSDPPKAAQIGYYRTAAYSPAAVQSAHRAAKLRLARTISRIAANDPQLTKVKLSPRELVYGPWEHHIVPYCDEVNQRFLCYHMNDAELQKLSEALRGNQYVRHVGKEKETTPFFRRILYSKSSLCQDRLGTNSKKLACSLGLDGQTKFKIARPWNHGTMNSQVRNRYFWSVFILQWSFAKTGSGQT